MQYLQTYSASIQALSSVILIVVTAFYVVLTYKLLHTPHKAFLIILSIKSDNKGWILKIKNLGPGLAKNLQIKTVVQKILDFDPIKKGTVWLENTLSPASGPFQLMPNEEGEYCFGPNWISFDDPFYITWQSINGKKQKTAWLDSDVRRGSFIPLNFEAAIKWKIKWYKINLFSPWNRFKRWRIFKKATKLKRTESIPNSEYKIVAGIHKMDFAKITAMLKDAFWSKGIGIDEVKQGADNSALVVGAFTQEGLQIGYSRVISDKIRFAYIIDVYVDKNFRKRGIGQAMIKFILNHPELKDVYQWLLITKDAHGVYSKASFKPLENPDRWMEIRNPRPDR